MQNIYFVLSRHMCTLGYMGQYPLSNTLSYTQSFVCSLCIYTEFIHVGSTGPYSLACVITQRYTALTYQAYKGIHVWIRPVC